MLARKQEPRPPLEQRIAEFRRELDSFILGRAIEIKKGTPGVPLDNILQMLNHNLGCQCAVATQIVADRRRDSEIASCQESK